MSEKTLRANGRSRGSRSGNARLRFFDDPKLRVQLSEEFRRALRALKQVHLAAGVRSPRRDGVSSTVDPSSISRYAAGKIAPTLRIARELGRAVGRPLAEAVAGFAPQHVQSTGAWAVRMLSSRTYRAQVLELIDMFSNVLELLHLGVITDGERQHRSVVRSPHVTVGYGYFEIALDWKRSARQPCDFVLSYMLFDSPPVYVDYGRIALQGSTIEATEFWTKRVARLTVGTRSRRRLWVQTWLDGKGTDFVVRSSRPFTLGTMLSRRELPRPYLIVPFRPCGIHRHASASNA